MHKTWIKPKNHPLSLERARELIKGDLGDVYKKILINCCAPIFWFGNDTSKSEILNNGTLTFLKTPKLLLGVTANHVMQGLEDNSDVKCQIFDFGINDLDSRIIDRSEKLDLITFDFTNLDLKKLDKDIQPLSTWPPYIPEENAGIMIGGYPGKARQQNGFSVDFGFCPILCIARCVSNTQITWKADHEYNVEDDNKMSQHYDLGGISGGPLITWVESENYFTHYRLGGIVTEASSALELVTATRADFISENGRIIKVGC